MANCISSPALAIDAEASDTEHVPPRTASIDFPMNTTPQLILRFYCFEIMDEEYSLLSLILC